LFGPVAVMTPVCVVVIVPAFAVNDAETDPAGMEMLAGVLKSLLLLLRDTDVLEVAALLRVAVHFELPAE
jgi:hypothetical protein